MIDVLHCVPSLDLRHGGPSRTVVELVDALATNGVFSIHLLSQKRQGKSSATPSAAVQSRLVQPASHIGAVLAWPIRSDLSRWGGNRRPILVHSHGIWHPANHWAAWAARRWAVPLVVQPRGMLDPWAMKQKAMKKSVAMALFQRRDLANAQALVATSELEYENIRRLRFRKPVAVIPNGVAVAESKESSAILRAPGGPRTVLFLSRIHPGKGVLELVEAWAQVAPAGWQLKIAGPDEDGYWPKVAVRVKQLAPRSEIIYLGHVEGDQKIALYREADLFVLPTYSENFGMVVAEALSYGIPVITTRNAPWADLERFECGWWIDTGVEPLVKALCAAMALGDDERAAMGARACEYVKRYDWDEIASKTVAFYRWLLGHGERPECVRWP